ncbi:hypothetical protein [Flavobacterium sp. CF136]|uniref:hypothetical protein n=1 Tax=Flavobacterium sp. (strain CF136) TaxID=1144313 RepID=UPI0002719F00|nr:hypothetical protein [Flavobacterium sp. CF136]EJL66286.1 hypothetical protein PMI10_00634 [Flavobacterium sp. CF136]
MNDEENAKQELMNMSSEQLELVDHDLFKWICSGKNCCRSTKVRDYGIHPIYYHKRITPHFMNMNYFYFMCAKHYKIYKALIKNYPVEKVREKLFDFTKPRLIKL